MFGRVTGTRPNISESHSEISTRVPFRIATFAGRAGTDTVRGIVTLFLQTAVAASVIVAKFNLLLHRICSEPHDSRI